MTVASQNDAVEMTFSLKLDRSLFCNYLKDQLESHKETFDALNRPLCRKNFSIVEQESHESLGTLIMRLASSFDSRDHLINTSSIDCENHSSLTEVSPGQISTCENFSVRENDKQVEKVSETKKEQQSSLVNSRRVKFSSAEVSVQTDPVVLTDSGNHIDLKESAKSANLSLALSSTDVTERQISDVAIKTEPENTICDYNDEHLSNFEPGMNFVCQSNEVTAIKNGGIGEVEGFDHPTTNELDEQNGGIFNDWSNAYDSSLLTGANDDIDAPFQAVSNQIALFKSEIINDNDGAYSDFFLENIVSEISQPSTSRDLIQQSQITYLDGFEVSDDVRMDELHDSIIDTNFINRPTSVSGNRFGNSSVSESELDCGEIFEVEKDVSNKKMASSRPTLIPASRGQAIKSASFKCNMCEYKTHYYPLIQNHLFRSHQKKINVLSKDVQYECKLCLYRGNSSKSFKEHFRRQHYTQRPSDSIFLLKNRCKFCKFEATNKISLREHVKRKHAEKITEIDTSDEAVYESIVAEKVNDYLTCHLCPFQTNWRKNLYLHFQENHTIKGDTGSCGIDLDKMIKFKCNLCFYNTFRKFNMKTHVQRVHTKALADSYLGSSTTEGHELKLFAHIEYPDDLIKLQRAGSSDANGQVIGGFGDPNALELSPGGAADVELVEPPEVEEIRSSSTTMTSGPPYKCPLCPFTTNAKSPLNVHTSRFHKFASK
ncbi:uncharacterized protein LOC142351255 isoform X2 [Convolutriloba macropyga]|uniref:uncharacterized protein LOC142351255 isoform X2 n=1 Tax=Convolutriloba macropyga TaxID=536237 RepID=UPI003F523D1E